MYLQPSMTTAIKSVSGVIRRRHYERFDHLFFAVLYAVFIYTYLTDVIERKEVAVIVAVGLILIHALVLLSCQWGFFMKATVLFKKTKGLSEGCQVLVTATDGASAIVDFISKVPFERSQLDFVLDEPINAIGEFEFKKTKFLLSPSHGSNGWEARALESPSNHPINFYKQWRGYLSEDSVRAAHQLWGANECNFAVPDFWSLYYQQLLSPMFIFQAFCMLLYCFDDYFVFSLFTLIMLLFLESTLTKQRLKNFSELQEMKQKPVEIYAYRLRKWRKITSDDLVPGDIVSITRSAQHTLPCDILLLSGSCIVTEALLTGETIPQLKEPLVNASYEDTMLLTALSEQNSKRHVLYSGTEVIQMANYGLAQAVPGAIQSPDNGCVGFVLRTGLMTEQGKLLGTIMNSTAQLSANNSESLAVIGFLLVFALSAASYVWLQSVGKRSYYKLAVHCMLIVTSVVPPDLPIQLSLAVNQSLVAIRKLTISCTEPFRIPFAGKVDVCCFDKTGTLTTNSMDVVGIAGLNGEELILLEDLHTSHPASVQALAGCHSLALMSGQLLGDPLEIATMGALKWTLSSGDHVSSYQLPGQHVTVIRRFHFNSELKRMSVVLATQSNEQRGFMVATKGAPEIVKKYLTLSSIPANYDQIAKKFTCEGARVLAIAYKTLDTARASEMYNLTREDAECQLNFGGFLVVNSPMKQDSQEAIAFLRTSSHHVVMITGDNALTACFVAKELHIIDADALILTLLDGKWVWLSADETVTIPFDKTKLALERLVSDWHLCLTGAAIEYIHRIFNKDFATIIAYADVFARVSPEQKAMIVAAFNSLGAVTLMCGDGTNDVAALKMSHVGLAIVPGTHSHRAKKRSPKNPDEKKSLENTKNKPKDLGDKLKEKGLVARTRPIKQEQLPKVKQQDFLTQIQAQLAELQGDENIPKLGDASTAAPFASKSSSILAVCNLIRQGRCTLVITLQMIIILSLNSLLTSYSMSVLYLDGVKISDTQMTVQALFLVTCVLMISKATPLDELSRERPYGHVLHPYAIVTILGQFAIHLFLMTYALDFARGLEDRVQFNLDEDKFKMSILNSVVYVLTLTMQLTTFTVNYRGYPFMLPLRENKPLLRTLIAGAVFVLLLISGLVDLQDILEITEFSWSLQITLFTVVIADLAGCTIVDRVLRFIFDRRSSSLVSRFRG